MGDVFIRIFVGGLVVSAFAVIGEMLRPKSFAGLLGAAPSVALATLTLTAIRQGSEYVSIEAKSMILGAIAYLVYATVVSQLLIRWRLAVLPVTVAAMVVWFTGAFGLWFVFIRTVA